MSINPNDEEGMKAILLFMLAAIKANIENDGHLVPIAAVYFAEEPPVHVPAEVGTENWKENWILDIETVLNLRADACAVFVAAEAWEVLGAPETLQKIVEETGGRLANVEERREVVHASLEHASFGMTTYVAHVLRGDGAVRLTPFKQTPTASASGRFTALLKRHSPQ